jgi:hypothetical protein
MNGIVNAYSPSIANKECEMQTPILCLDRKAPSIALDHRQAAFIHRFAQGCNGTLISAAEAWDTPIEWPWVIRGMKFGRCVQQAMQTGRVFYYIDNGYFGNQRHKTYFRVIKNHVHDVRPVIPRSRDRLDRCEVGMKPFTPGSKILLAPPSAKSFTLWDIDQDQWIQDTIAEIKKHTDRPIEVRLKRKREERLRENTMEQALEHAHCLVTYNSVSAVEAIMLGKPAFTLGPNAAAVLSLNDLSQIESPRIPSDDEREQWMRHLSYSQFTFSEMTDGTAWSILNG